ncbi:hypothetical protein [Chitinilyticum piscinae]|uniref:Uncharacterized protein n=1 Tax=Chitinilyticum piscinae TaxID=2866724 RepID=A0A8J7G121_9NEIS|nr:hypothetical protein [Chitinilyticum piscinae]MBE9610010.1 hypothetical protein [Chitinilyticum piscinae]
MGIPLSIKIKSFFGLYVLTPFEENLLEHLRKSLDEDGQKILDFQMSNFTIVRRFIKPLNDPRSHGYTNFYTCRFGINLAKKRQVKHFKSTSSDGVLATAEVVFFEGRIEVKFILVDGVLFRIEYRSPQKIYYPPSEYRVLMGLVA